MHINIAEESRKTFPRRETSLARYCLEPFICVSKLDFLKLRVREQWIFVKSLRVRGDPGESASQFAPTTIREYRLRWSLECSGSAFFKRTCARFALIEITLSPLLDRIREPTLPPIQSQRKKQTNGSRSFAHNTSPRFAECTHAPGIPKEFLSRSHFRVQIRPGPS